MYSNRSPLINLTRYHKNQSKVAANYISQRQPKSKLISCCNKSASGEANGVFGRFLNKLNKQFGSQLATRRSLSSHVTGHTNNLKRTTRHRLQCCQFHSSNYQHLHKRRINDIQCKITIGIRSYLLLNYLPMSTRFLLLLYYY